MGQKQKLRILLGMLLGSSIILYCGRLGGIQLESDAPKELPAVTAQPSAPQPVLDLVLQEAQAIVQETPQQPAASPPPAPPPPPPAGQEQQPSNIYIPKIGKHSIMQSCIDEVVWTSSRLKPMELTPQEIAQTKKFECIDVRPGVNTTDGPVVYKMCLHDDKSDPAISAQLRQGELFEASNLESVAQYLIDYPQSVFIDIGANMGLFSLMAAKMGHPVIAVEPRPENVHRIYKAVTDAKYENVTVYQNAVSDVRTTMHLMTRLTQQGATWVVCKDLCVSYKNDSCTNDTVDTIYIDDLLPVIQAMKRKQAIVKMDIEGHEPHALGVSGQFFEELDIPFFIMEWKSLKNAKGEEGIKQSESVIKMFESRRFYATNPSVKTGPNRKLEGQPFQKWPVDVAWIKEGA